MVRATDLFDLTGLVAVVSGAGQGIGEATARLLADAGAAVALVGRRREPLERVARAIGAERSLVATADVARADAVAAMVDEVIARWGKIDILVNNAGVGGPGKLDQITPDEWDALLDVNLRGAFLCTRAIFKSMQERRQGVVVNLASISGQTGGMSANAPYAASKGGLIAFTKALARQMAPWGRANAIAPGQIATEMGTRNPAQVQLVEQIAPLQRLGTPDEIAAGVLFLAAPASSYITGHVLNINGGLLME